MLHVPMVISVIPIILSASLVTTLAKTVKIQQQIVFLAKLTISCSIINAIIPVQTNIMGIQQKCQMLVNNVTKPAKIVMVT